MEKYKKAIHKVSFQELKKELAELGIEGYVFDYLKKTFQRKYRQIPKNYHSPDEIIKSLICYLFDPSSGKNTASFSSALVCSRMANNYCPWYWLGEDLAQDLILTDIPKTIPDKLTLPKIGLIVLPNNLLTESVSFFAYQIYEAGEKIIVNQNETKSKKTEKKEVVFSFPPESKIVVWFGSLGNGIELIGGNFGLLPKPGELELILNEVEHNTSAEKQIFNLLINCLLFANPSNIDLPEKGTTRKGFGKKSQTLYNPLWIGKAYKRSTPTTEKGTHASPRTHYRRGHYRRSRIGTGRKEYKWNWIKPTLININKSENQNNR